MRPLLVLLSALSLATCGGDPGPKYTLKVVMAEVELKRAAMERALLRDGGAPDVVEAAVAIEKWLKDPAKERYLASDAATGTPAQFASFEASFLPRLEAVLAAARSGDEQAAREAFPALQAGCNACHVVFRPDLASR